MHTVVIGADLQSLVTAHDETSLPVLLVLEQPDVTCSALLPLPTFTVEPEELGSHLEDLLLRFLVCFGVNLLCKMDDWFEVNVRLSLIGLFFLLSSIVSFGSHDIFVLYKEIHTSSPSFFLELPDGSSASSTGSSFFCFAGPPPNMEKTFAFTADAVSVTDSVTVLGLSPSSLASVCWSSLGSSVVEV